MTRLSFVEGRRLVRLSPGDLELVERFDQRVQKNLHPIPQFKLTAKLGEFLESRFSQSF